MRLDVMRVANYRALGEKIKAWSKGTERLPADLDEMKAQLAAAQVGASIPEQIKKGKFVACDGDTLVVRLLPKELLEKSKEALASGAEEYVLPPLYERAFRTKPSVSDKLAFQAERIGDYSIAYCQ